MTTQVYLNIDVDRKPFGKVVIEIYDDVPIGGQRFLDLAIGKEGVRYRSSKFIRLAPVPLPMPYLHHASESDF